MTDYDALCKRLRLSQHLIGNDWRRVMIAEAIEAADAITALREQVAALQPPEPDTQKKIVSEMADDYDRMGDPEIAAALRSCLSRAEAAEANNAALRQLLADMKPHWDGFTRKVIWTAQMAGVMADIRTRLDAALLAGKSP